MADKVDNERRKRFNIGRALGVLTSLVSTKFPWLSPILKGLSARRRVWASVSAGLVAIAIGAWQFGGSILHVLSELSGPDVIISVLPPVAKLGEYGQKRLLYEFEFEKPAMAAFLSDDGSVRALWTTGKPIPVVRVACNEGGRSSPSDLYKLSVVVQNRGDRTANDYKMVITFSGEDLVHVDPGVRIAHVESDALKVDYVYQQEPEIPLPSCIMEEKKSVGGKPSQNQQLNEISATLGKIKEILSPPPEKPSALARMTYKELELTRDLVIVKGTLEAHLFQIVDLVIKVPDSSKKFAILYHVECGNCRFFYRTSSYGQIVQLQEGVPSLVEN